MAILDRKPPLPDGDGAAAVASAESFEALHSSSPHGLSTSSNWQSTQAQPEHVYISTHDGQAPPSYDLATSSNNLSQLPPPQPVEVPTMGSSNEVHEYTPLLADVEYGGRRPGDRDGRQGKNGQKRRVCLRRFFRFATSAITILLFWVIIMDMMSMMSSSIGSDSDSHEELQKPNPNLWPGNTIDWPDWSPVTRQPGENEQYSSTTHLTLDANHGSLFIHNFGQRHSGKVTLETSRGTGDKIQVDVEARATHEFILKEALTVVKKEDGNRFGVGIYSQNRSFEDGRHRLRVYVTVTLPRAAAGVRKYGDFEIKTDISFIQADAVGTAVLFKSFHAASNVGSVRLGDGFKADKIVELTTSVGSIKSTGLIDTDVFRAISRVGSLSFDTIDATESATLQADSGSVHIKTVRSPVVSIQTSAGSISAEEVESWHFNAEATVGSVRVGVSPVAHPRREGSEPARAEIHSSEGSVDVKYRDSGVDAKPAKLVRSNISSKVGNVAVEHWPSFLGKFDFTSQISNLDIKFDRKGTDRDMVLFRKDEILKKHAYGCIYNRKEGLPRCSKDVDISSSDVSSSMGSVMVRF